MDFFAFLQVSYINFCDVNENTSAKCTWYLDNKYMDNGAFDF